ncbi:MAG: protein kinase [Verrucomicrobia bacterium]|nr:protein kinase [Verrucomicrobiota bacterium]
MPSTLYFSHYRVLEREDGTPWRLGVGPTGVTYKAFDEKLHLPVALKVISPSRLLDPTVQALFLREARAAARVRHPNVASVLALEDQPGNIFAAMEFIDGLTLEELLRQRQRLRTGQALLLAVQIARGLESIHRAGILHRDLKPANILLLAEAPERWLVKVINFGLGRALAGEKPTTATVALTAGSRAAVTYASPEQCLERDELDVRSDLYALGCLLWEMLVGRPPFAAGTHHETVAQHVSQPPPLAEIARQPLPVRSLLSQLLAKEPRDRPPTAAAVALALEDALHQPEAGAAASTTSTTSIGRAPALDASPMRKSVAVLPFATQGASPEQQYFADGLTEELLNALGKVGSLRVVSRASAFNFRGSTLPRPEIAQKLGVTFLVDGSVRFSGAQVLITAQLVAGGDGFQIWSETYERAVPDLFAAQDEIALAVAGALELKLAPRAVSPPSPEAYRFFLEGRNAWRQRTPTSLDHAQDCLERALLLEPRFARALVALADVPLARVDLAIIGNQPSSTFVPTIREAMERARAAIELEPDLAEAHASLGLAHRFLGERTAAIQCYRHAIALNPNYAPVYQWLARGLTADGRLEEALEQSATGVMLDPLAPRIVDNHALLLLLAGRVADALEAVERGLATAPEDVQLRTWRIWALSALGRSREVLGEARAILAQPRSGYYHIALRVLLAAGQRIEAEASAAAFPSAAVLARCRAALLLGHRQTALELLDARYLPYISHDALLFDPMWDTIRMEPRFLEVLAELDLVSAHSRAQAWRKAHPQAAQASVPSALAEPPRTIGAGRTGLTELDAGGPPPPARLARWEFAALAVVLCVVAGVGLAAWMLPEVRKGTPSASAAQLAGAPRSVALLPLLDRSPDGSTAALTRDFNERLQRALEARPGLEVSSREAVAPFRERTASYGELCRALGVRYVLDGSIRQAGQRLRVSLQFVSANDGHTLWSESFDTAPEGLGAIPEEVIRLVARSLELPTPSPPATR